MNATDLMLGDYVQVEDDEGKLFTDCVCDIGYVPQWNELGIKTIEGGNEWISESEIVPLSLTKEIIEKNFTLNKKHQEQFGANHCFYYSIIPKCSSGIWNLVWIEGNNENYLTIEDDPLIRMKYVHELQHALKLCRINKEIVLEQTLCLDNIAHNRIT